MGGYLSGVPGALLLVEVKHKEDPHSKAELTPNAYEFACALWEHGQYGVYEVSQQEADLCGAPQLAGRKLVYMVIVVTGLHMGGSGKPVYHRIVLCPHTRNV